MLTPNPSQMIIDTMDRLGSLAKKRAPHLKRLFPVEQLIRKLAPLSCSYDIVRIQPQYFAEFTYTEMLGGMLVSPQNCEAQARMVEMAMYHDGDEAAQFIEARDKYMLERAPVDPRRSFPRRVVFPPGSNVFMRFVSKENLSRLMFEDESVVIKPHPLTDEGLLRLLCREFGYHRVLKPDASGMDYLARAEEVWVTTTTEMGLYAMLQGKAVHNVGNFFEEARASFNAFYRVLWPLSVDARRMKLIHMLSSPLSGWLHPDDKDLEARLRTYFDEAMRVREHNRPLVHELSTTRYQEAILGHAKPPGADNERECPDPRNDAAH